ncbi:MAG: LysR family transcriptional regulator [Actinomycetota bacterium]
MDIDDLIAVRAILAAGTFTAAARELRVAQPALSRRISRLEDELGGRLFERLPRHAAPTALGESVAAAASRMIAELDRAREDAVAIARGAAGRIRMSSLAGGIPALARGIVRFQERNRDVVLELTAQDADDAVRALREHRADLATLPGSAVGEGMSARTLGRWRINAVVARGHRFARRRSVPVTELAREPLLMLAPEFMVARHVLNLATRTGLRLRIRLSNATPEAALSLARRGWGVAVLPDTVRVPADVVAVPLARAGTREDFEYVIAWLADPAPGPAVLDLVETLVRETAAFRT